MQQQIHSTVVDASDLHIMSEKPNNIQIELRFQK